MAYGAILALNASRFVTCFREYVQTEEQWLFHILAENTGTTQVSTRRLAAFLFPESSFRFMGIYCIFINNSFYFHKFSLVKILEGRRSRRIGEEGGGGGVTRKRGILKNIQVEC